MQSTDIGTRHRGHLLRPERGEDVLLPQASVLPRRPRLPPALNLVKVRRSEFPNREAASCGAARDERIDALGCGGELAHRLVPRLLGRQRTVDAKSQSPKLPRTLRPVTEHENLAPMHMPIRISTLGDANAEAFQLRVPDEVVAAWCERERINGALGEIGSRHFEYLPESRRKPTGSHWKPI